MNRPVSGWKAGQREYPKEDPEYEIHSSEAEWTARRNSSK